MGCAPCGCLPCAGDGGDHITMGQSWLEDVVGAPSPKAAVSEGQGGLFMFQRKVKVLQARGPWGQLLGGGRPHQTHRF